MNATTQEINQWWNQRRATYNRGLIIAGILAFILYVIIGVRYIMPYDPNFEINLFTSLFQALTFGIMLVFANLFYNLGPWTDKKFNSSHSETFRKNLFRCGFWFSVLLPFLVPLGLWVQYVMRIK